VDVQTRYDIFRTVKIEVKLLLTANRIGSPICYVDWHSSR